MERQGKCLHCGANIMLILNVTSVVLETLALSDFGWGGWHLLGQHSFAAIIIVPKSSKLIDRSGAVENSPSMSSIWQTRK
jgi:hypothetical protein